MKADTLFRVTIKPDSKSGVDPFKLCRDRSVVGTGWRIDDPVPCSLDEYEQRGREVYGGRGFTAMVHALKDMKVNDLVWTRRPWSSDYYLCRITGGWRYENSPECDAADIHNLIPVEFIEIKSIDLVPGKVVNCFRSSLEMSMRIYNMYGSAGAIYDVDPVTDEGILQLLLPEDVEELVLLYLQVEYDYLLYSSSNKIYTAQVECEMVKRDGSMRCYPHDYTNLVSDTSEVFLFSTDPSDDNRCCPGVTVITNDELITFMQTHREILPRRIKWWLENK